MEALISYFISYHVALISFKMLISETHLFDMFLITHKALQSLWLSNRIFSSHNTLEELSTLTILFRFYEPDPP